MFETVRPSTFSLRSRKIFIETLPLSIGFHVLLVVAMLVTNVWKVSFPQHTPKLLSLYRTFDPPTPPPPPPPPAAAPKQVPAQMVQVQQPQEIVAPTVIPDQIPLVTQQPLPQVVEMTPVEGVTGGIEGGVEGGVVGGAVGGDERGEIGGTMGGTVGGVVTDPVPPNTVVVQRDAPLPMQAMSRVYPKYPEEARIRGYEDVVLVRYTIGKNGRVREVKILEPGKRKEFTEAAVNAIKHWRFRPLTKDGQAQEVVHEMTVIFQLEASS